MRSILIIFSFLFLTTTAGAQDKASSAGKVTPKTVLNKVVEASCGQCQFNMAGKSCDLAVRIDGKAYFVDGTGIDEHGNAHAKDGFCQKVRKALVSGHIEGDRFKATSFKLLHQ